MPLPPGALEASAAEESFPAGGAGTGRPQVSGLNRGLANIPCPPPQAASAGPDLTSWVLPNRCPALMVSAGPPCGSGLDARLSSDAAVSGQAPRAPGFVPYYRTPEEGLHTSPGPPACLSGARSPRESCPDLVQPYCEEAEGGSSKSHQDTGPQHPLVTEGRGGWGKGPRAQLALGPELQALSPLPQCSQPAELAGGAQSLAGSPSPSQDTELAWQGDPVHC